MHLIKTAMVVICLSTVPVATARSQDRPSQAFSDTIDVRVINIETVVTDGKGHRVTGLGPGDFRLLVDGRPVPIDYFSEIRDGQSVPSDVSGVTPAVSGSSDASIPDFVPSNYLVFVDNVFPRGAQRNLVLEKLAKQIDLLATGDRMAVMAFDGRQLTSLTNWTDSKQEIRQAFARAAERPSGGFFRDTEKRSFAEGTEGAARILNAAPFSQATGYATLLESQIRGVVGAASTAIRVAGRPDGRRIMLLLSGGWPWEVLSPGDLDSDADPGLGPGTDWDTHLRASMLRMSTLDYYLLFPHGLEIYQMLSDAANLSGYTLYPVDVPGLGGVARDVTARGPSMTGPPSTLGSDQENLNEGTLVLLANQTGGRALLNDLRLTALDRAIDDTRTYYWLGFQVESQYDNRRHRIEVEARDKGLEIRARKNYLDLSREAEVAMANEAALYLRDSDDGGLIVTLGPVQRLERGRMQVPVKLSIPVDDITLVPVDEGWAAFLEVLVRARDRQQGVSDLDSIPINLLTRTEPEAGSRTYYEFSVTLEEERHELAITVHDFPSDRTMTTYASVQPSV